MARPPRIEFQGAFYHIITRGNQLQTIFYDDHDREKYLELIEKYKERHGFKLYAYTLMTNHVHLLIETPKSPISKIMQAINFTYTNYFNRRHNKVGHLFQGRYKAYLCDKDNYLLSLIRYIHLNPIRARLAESPFKYKWSSHRDYLKGSKSIVETDKVLRLFSEKPSQARQLYKRFVDMAIGIKGDGSIYNVHNQQILGDDTFIEKIERSVEILHKPFNRPALKKILLSVSKVTGVAQDEIMSRSRNGRVMQARHVLVGACREVGYKLVDLQSQLIKRELSVLSRWCSASENKDKYRLVQQVFKQLNARLQA